MLQAPMLAGAASITTASNRRFDELRVDYLAHEKALAYDIGWH